MDKINELIQFADDNDIGLLYRHIPETKSFAIPGCVVIDTDYIYHPVLTHDMIMAAVADGCTEPYAIADHYDLPVRYVAQACFYDQNGYMMPDYLLEEYPDEVPED